MSSALAEAFVTEELSLIQSLDAPTPREISGLADLIHDGRVLRLASVA
jgi:hypothetical protein